MADKPTLEELGGDYVQDTEQWFEAWRASPRTDGWDMPQWQYMKDTAAVHSLIYGQGMFEMMPDLEKRLDKLGLTFEPAKQTGQRGGATKLELIQGNRARRAEARRASGGAGA